MCYQSNELIVHNNFLQTDKTLLSCLLRAQSHANRHKLRGHVTSRGNARSVLSNDEDRLNWLELFNDVCGFNQSLMKAATLRQLSRRVDEIQFQSLPVLPL